MKLCSTQAFTRFSYSRRFSLYSWAAIELAGEFGFGSLSKDCKSRNKRKKIHSIITRATTQSGRNHLTCIDVRIADTSYVGDQRFCRMSRQMPPSAYTFGWNIFDTKRTVGGLFGYSSVNSIVSLKVPSSNGVSCGPKITAFQIMMLLSVGAPDTPVGGSSCSLHKRRKCCNQLQFCPTTTRIHVCTIYLQTSCG